MRSMHVVFSTFLKHVISLTKFVKLYVLQNTCIGVTSELKSTTSVKSSYFHIKYSVVFQCFLGGVQCFPCEGYIGQRVSIFFFSDRFQLQLLQFLERSPYLFFYMITYKKNQAATFIISILPERGMKTIHSELANRK